MVSDVTRIDLPAQQCESILRTDHRHDHPCCFVAGPENRLAIPILQQLLDGPNFSLCGSALPLVLTGPSGVGKSFLVQGISRRWTELLGAGHVGYFTAIDFGRMLRDTRNDGKLAEFFGQFQKLDLFILEDLHRLPNSSYVHRQLRELLDTLTESTNCMLLITSQQAPGVDPHLELGLRDRLNAGLVLQLRQPGPEAKIDLLDLTAASRGLQLDFDVLENIASEIDGPAPRFFQALSDYQVRESAKQQGISLKKDAANEADLKQIVAVVARYYSLTQAAIRSSARRKSLVYARGIAIYLSRSLTNLSYAQIGNYLGNRDHTTIMHAYTKIEKLVAEEIETQESIAELRRILTAS